MAVIFNIDEAVKRSDWGLLVEPIKLAFTNKAEPFEKESHISKYFNVRATTKFEEKFRSEGRTMGEFKLSDDLSEYPLDDNGEGFDKAIGVVEWKNAFVVSKQVLEDVDMGRIRNNVTQLTKGYFRGREYFARNIIGGGFTGKYSYTRQDGRGAVKVFDCTTLDSVTGALDQLYKVPLFSVVHRLPENHLKVGASGYTVVQGNKFNAIGGIDLNDPLAVGLVQDFLAQIRNKGKNFLGEDGKTAGYTYNTIVVGTNDYRLAKVIREAIAEDSSWKLVEDEYLDALPQFAASEKAFLVLSPEALADTDGAVWLDRVKLTIKSYVDENNDANIWAGRARYGAGFVTYRHIAVATLKSLTEASTLPGTVGGIAITDKASLADRHGVLLSTITYGPKAAPDDWNDCFFGLTPIAHGKPIAIVNEVKTVVDGEVEVKPATGAIFITDEAPVVP